MTCLYESATDLSMAVKGLRSVEEASGRFPRILTELANILARVKAQRPAQRRNGDLDASLDWLHRSLHDSELLTKDQEDRAETIVREIKGMVGAQADEWWPATPKRAAVT